MRWRAAPRRAGRPGFGTDWRWRIAKPQSDRQQPPIFQRFADQSAVIRRESERALSRFGGATFGSRGPFRKTKTSTHDSPLRSWKVIGQEISDYLGGNGGKLWDRSCVTLENHPTVTHCGQYLFSLQKKSIAMRMFSSHFHYPPGFCGEK